MNVEEIYKEYSLKIAPLYMHQRSIKRISDEEIRKSIEYKNTFKDNSFVNQIPASVDNFYFYGARDGIAKLLAFKTTSIEEKVKMLILHKNKQYQWLLAEAYEVYEDFLQNIYAYLGFSNMELWPLSDFGSISYNELKNKDFDYFLKQAKDKKGVPHSILSKIRDILPIYTRLEVDNKLERNIKLMVILIEKLRHFIVHKSGVVNDKKVFIETVLEKAGLINNGKYDKTLFEYISQYFGNEEYENTIALLEIKVNLDLPIVTEIEPLNILIDTLSASVHAICEEIIQVLQKK